MKNWKATITIAISALALFLFSKRERGEAPKTEPNKVELAATPSLARPELSRSEKIRAALEELNTPIDFWGQVVDQDGNGIEGATVTFRLGRGDLTLGRGTENAIRSVSDSAGGFSFQGLEGFRISLISIDAEGYRLASRQNTTLNYLEGEAEGNSPVNRHKFYMIDIEQTDTLSFFEYQLFIKWEGEPIFLNLRNGVVNGRPADLEVVAVRRPGEARRYNWEFSVTNVNGGGIARATPDGPPTIAPTDGYQSEWSIGYLHNDDNYRGGGDWDLFSRTKEGNYARIHITAYLSEKRRNTNLILRVFINESGGRILEDASTNSRY